MRFTLKLVFPELDLFPDPLFAARTVSVQAGGNDAGFAEAMIEHDQAVVKTDVTVRQFKIVHGPARQFRLGKVFQIITPETKAPSERKRQVDFFKQFEARHQSIEQMPGIAKLNVMRDA